MSTAKTAAALLAASLLTQGCSRCYEYIEVEPNSAHYSAFHLDDGEYDLIIDEILDSSCGIVGYERDAIDAWLWSEGEETWLEAGGLLLSGWQRDGEISLEGPLRMAFEYGDEEDWGVDVEDKCDTLTDSDEDSCGTDGVAPSDGWLQFEARVVSERRASGVLWMMFEDGGPGCELKASAHLAPARAFDAWPAEELEDSDDIDGEP